jgi:hypothetical protein
MFMVELQQVFSALQEKLQPFSEFNQMVTQMDLD